jgi:sugar phosphate isomerase/epimerase
MDLDQIIGYVKGLGTNGIEILPDQMLHGTPNPEPEEIERFRSLVKKHNVELACDDVFLNTNLFKNRNLTKRESIDLIKQEIVLANKLGFRTIRLVSCVPDYVLEPCLEMAERMDVSLNIEIHAGLGFGVKKTDDFINEMLRLNSPYIGMVPDTSLFCRRKPQIVADYCDKVMGGLNPELIQYVDEVFASGTDFFALSTGKGLPIDPKLDSLIRNEADKFFAWNISGYENRPLSCMDGLEKFIAHVHFKLYQMMDNGQECSIDYEEILNYLHQAGYNGYVATEYEGNRWIMPGLPVPPVECEQVAAHQKLINDLIKKIEG